jgi:hypothetical protein
LSFSQTPDEDLVIENSDGEKLEPCLWSFSFLVDKYSLYAFVDDLLLELYSMGAIVRFIIDKHLSDKVVAQN